MKVPTIDEARKIVSDADLGVGCVIDEKELILARFVFDFAPSLSLRRDSEFKYQLQQIIDASANSRQATVDENMKVAIVRNSDGIDLIAMRMSARFDEVKEDLRAFMLTFLVSVAFICFILGIILYKLS